MDKPQSKRNIVLSTIKKPLGRVDLRSTVFSYGKGAIPMHKHADDVRDRLIEKIRQFKHRNACGSNKRLQEEFKKHSPDNKGVDRKKLKRLMNRQGVTFNYSDLVALHSSLDLRSVFTPYVLETVRDEEVALLVSSRSENRTSSPPRLQFVALPDIQAFEVIFKAAVQAKAHPYMAVINADKTSVEAFTGHVVGIGAPYTSAAGQMTLKIMKEESTDLPFEFITRNAKRVLRIRLNVPNQIGLLKDKLKSELEISGEYGTIHPKDPYAYAVVALQKRKRENIHQLIGFVGGTRGFASIGAAKEIGSLQAEVPEAPNLLWQVARVTGILRKGEMYPNKTEVLVKADIYAPSSHIDD